MVEALGKADRNRNHRARNIRFKLLPGAWLSDLCEFGLGIEGRIARATASLWRTKSAETFLRLAWSNASFRWLVRFENVPFRRVWVPTTLQANLAAVVERRLVDVEKATACPPFQASLYAPLADVGAWLRGETDETELERWLLRFSLFHFDQESIATVRQHLSVKREVGAASGVIAAVALLKPLFEPLLFTEIMRDTRGRKNPRCARVARIGTLLFGAAILRPRWNLPARHGTPPECGSWTGRWIMRPRPGVISVSASLARC